MGASPITSSLTPHLQKGNGLVNTKPKADGPTFPERVWEILACFRSVQLAIVLLSLLALATLAGVLIPQEGLVETAQIKSQFGQNYRMLKAMGFFQVYSSSWFITIEVLFFCSLLFGSFKWLRPAYYAATRRDFCGPEHILVSPNRFEVSSALTQHQILKTAAHTLKKQHYQVFWDKTQTRLYACKGNLSRLGPVVAHVGILSLLLASMFAAFTGFKAQELAKPGETFVLDAVDNMILNTPKPYWQGQIPDWKVRVNDFRIHYYENQPATAQQYYADLSILNPDGTERKRQTISVNHPMQIGDVTIYQASFDPTGRFHMTLNGKPRLIEAKTQFMDRRVGMIPLDKNNSLVLFPFMVNQDPGVKQNYVVAFLKTPHGFLGAGKNKMPTNLRLAEGMSGQIGNVTLGFDKPEVATGLQIKKAPEVPWMYLSFLVIITGTIMCIFSQRRIWLTTDDKNTLLVHFKTNKARLSFLKELKTLKGKLHAQLGS